MRRQTVSPKSQADGLERFLALEPRSRVLDLCCGEGRATLEMARRGHRVLGIDADERALAAGRAAAKGEKLNVHFMKADPREINYRGDFDAVLFLDGAFGKLPNDREDLRSLDAVRKALKPGAKLVIDALNREWLLRRFEPSGQVAFDFEKGRLDDRRSPPSASMRLYALTELIAQLDRAGLVYVRSWGGFDGSPYALESPRMIVLAERPKTEKPPRRGGPNDGLPVAIRIKGRR